MPAPHLPTEIHDIISSHLAQEDLPSYRRASKRLAAIGAQYLFRDLSFHASHASLNRIRSVGNSDWLRDSVQTMTWDISSLGLNACDFNDWKNRIRGLRRRELADLRETWRAQLLDHDAIEGCMQRFLWEQYERYTKLVAEEQEVQAQHLADILPMLAPFAKLKTIVVERKQYEVPPATPEDLELQAVDLLERGMLHRYGQDMFPLGAALRAAQISTRQIEARSLDFSVFGRGPYMEYLQHVDVAHITRLYLRFSLADPSSDPLESSMSIMNCKHVLRQGYLKDFLKRLESLQALGLDFDARSLGNGRAPVDLQDVFEAGKAWTKLRELAIYHADTPAPTITSLLFTHATSLKSLALGDICLDPPASWEALLMDIQPQLSLDRAEFSYFLFDARVENFLRGRSAMLGWYVDSQACVELGKSDLGERLETFMVKGDVCPLWEQKKIARVVGKLENGSVEDWVGGRHASVVT